MYRLNGCSLSLTAKCSSPTDSTTMGFQLLVAGPCATDPYFQVSIWPAFLQHQLSFTDSSTKNHYRG